MLVRQILNSKPEMGVLSVKPGSLVREAVTILSEKRIGSVVVSSDDGQTAEGILSERDIVRELGKRGPAVLDEPVESLATMRIVTCSESDTADQILQAMTDGRFRHLPVVRDGKLLGLISIGDVVKARLSELSMEKDALEGMIMGH